MLKAQTARNEDAGSDGFHADIVDLRAGELNAASFGKPGNLPAWVAACCNFFSWNLLCRSADTYANVTTFTGRKNMRTSRKAVMILMVGAMLIAAVAGVSAQGFGRMSGPATTVPAYGYRQQVPAAPFVPAQPQAPWAYQNQPRTWNRSANTFAFMGRMGRIGAGAYGALHSYQYAQLSAEDKAKVDKIIQESATEHLKLVTDLRAKRLELRNELWSATPDKAKIDSLTATINDLQKKILDLRNSKVLEINKIFQAASK